MNKQEFEQAIKDLEPLALRTLQNEMRAGGTNGLKAAELLLAYTQGKPVQSLDMGMGNALAGAAMVTINYVTPQQPLTIEGVAVPVGG